MLIYNTVVSSWELWYSHSIYICLCAGNLVQLKWMWENVFWQGTIFIWCNVTKLKNSCRCLYSLSYSHKKHGVFFSLSIYRYALDTQQCWIFEANKISIFESLKKSVQINLSAPWLTNYEGFPIAFYGWSALLCLK